MLHLIGLGLHESRRAYESGDKTFKFIEKATTGNHSFFQLLESLIGHVNIVHEAQNDLLQWVCKVCIVIIGEQRINS